MQALTHYTCIGFIMKKLLLCSLLLIQAYAYGQPMSLQAKKLKYLYQAMIAQPHAPVIKMQYIAAFPDNKVDFMDVFNHHTQDQLAAKSTDYVKVFRKLGYDYSDSVMVKAIAIGKEMSAWSEGPVDELQKAIYYITNKKPMLFVTTVAALKKTEQAALAQFLISGEDQKKNENYDTLLDILDKAGERKIHKIFAETIFKIEEIVEP